MESVGEGSGKLILFGEHAAVFGFPAIGISLPEQTRVAFHGPHQVSWELTSVAGQDRDIVRSLLDRLETILPELASSEARAVRVESSVPRGMGFGSSAALCTALARAALAHVSRGQAEPDLLRAWQLAHELERNFHGTPSGVDTGLSLLPGLTAFKPRPPSLPAWEHLDYMPFWLVVGALLRPASSAALIRGIGERIGSGDRTAHDALSSLGRIAADAKQAFTSKAPATDIGQLADRAMTTLCSLGLSLPALDLLLDKGRTSGALGGKLSGAGGGGAFFLVCADERTAVEVARSVEWAGRFKSISFAVAPRVLCAGV
jgi:mevalonate kinase